MQKGRVRSGPYCWNNQEGGKKNKMSAKSEKRTSRRLRYRRLRRPVNDRRGVSPVVATLILILIAVAAAAALYLWLVGWQGSVTGSISKPGVNQGTFTMGGSTSVFPFSSLGATWYEQNNTGVTITNTQGGTGAGMLAVCSGNIDVGAASTPETATGLIGSDGCPAADASTITITTIAYDAVDVVVADNNNHGLLSINYDTLAAIYDGASTSTSTLVPLTIDGVTISTSILDVAPWSTLGLTTHTALTWDQIPAMINGFAGPAGCGTEGLAAGIGVEGAAGQAAGTGPCANDIVTPTADDSPCGFTICAGPYVATPTAGAGPLAPIVPIERSDASGTTQTFEAKLFGATSATAFASSFAALGYSGCGSNNLLTDCGITLPASNQGDGNPGVLAAVAASPNALGYASDGLARTYANIGTAGIIPFLAVGQSLVSGSATSSTAYGGVVPTTGASGTIAAGITDSSSTNQYSGWRPFELVTLAPPSGVVESYVSFLLQVGINTNLATATGEVSVYSI